MNIESFTTALLRHDLPFNLFLVRVGDEIRRVKCPIEANNLSYLNQSLVWGVDTVPNRPELTTNQHLFEVAYQVFSTVDAFHNYQRKQI